MVLAAGGGAWPRSPGGLWRRGLHVQPRPGRHRSQPTDHVGLLHHQLRVLDRNQPRRRDALGHPAACAGRVAATRHPRSRGADRVLAHDGHDHAADSRRPSVARHVLGVPLRLGQGRVSQRAVGAGLGPLCGIHLPYEQHPVRVHRPDTGHSGCPGQDHGLEARSLLRAGAWLAGERYASGSCS